jgi:hypothetical protein
MENKHTPDFTVSEFTGKKIFFLNTSPFFQDEIGVGLIRQGFEIYYTNIYANLKKALNKFPESVVFVNTNNSLPETEWEVWIRRALADTDMAGSKFGVLAESHDERQQKTYIEALKLPGGYTVINKTAPQKTLGQLNGILTCLGARGRRKYVRAVSDNVVQMTVNIPHNGSYIEGKIGDISPAGISCTFQKDLILEKNTLCENMQIKLRSTILKAEGVFFGYRDDGMKTIYVFLFTRRVDLETRARIQFFIQNLLQERMTRFLV